MCHCHCHCHPLQFRQCRCTSTSIMMRSSKSWETGAQSPSLSESLGGAALYCAQVFHSNTTLLLFSFFSRALGESFDVLKPVSAADLFKPLALSVLSSLTKFHALVGVPRFFVLVTSSSSSFVGSVSARDVFCDASSSTPGCGAADFSCSPCRIPPA